MKDIRPQLEAIAAGRTLAAHFAGEHGYAVDPATVEKHQADFIAWFHFAQPRRGGEALAAPAEILVPLP